MMSTLEQTLEAMWRRIEALEAENARLAPSAPRIASSRQGRSRRQVLLGGAGVLGALAGSALVGRSEPARAASPVVQESLSQHEILQTTLTPLRSNGVLWARYEWHLGNHFAESTPPAVIATAADDYMDRDVTSSCSCSVLVEGSPGVYRAVIMVRGVHDRAQSVQVHAIAIGGR
jgi:hypothetical protein